MINSIGVHIKAKNFKTSVAFYKALGFKKVFEYGPDKKVKEAYRGITYEAGGSRLELADGHVAVRQSVFKESVLSSKMSLMVNVSDLWDIMNKARKVNIPLAASPRHYYWGTLEIVIKDPDGVVLVFIAPYSKKNAKKINADETFARQPAI